MHALIALLTGLGCSAEPAVTRASAPDPRYVAAASAGRGGTIVPKETRGELDLQLAGPAGPVTRPAQVVAVFDRPMVALGDLDAASAAVPIRCTPALGLIPRWAGSSTAVLAPTERFPDATEVTCTVPKGTRALDGSTLDEDVSWSFHTPAPRVGIDLDTKWWDDTDTIDPASMIRVSVEQGTTLDRVRAHVRVVEEDGGREVPLAITPAKGDDGRDRDDLFLVDAELRFDRAYRVEVREGLLGNEGPLPAEEQSRAFRTPGPLTASLDIKDGVGPTEFPAVTFNGEVDPTQVAPLLTITPKPPGGWRVAGESADRSVYVDTRLAPRTRYTVTLAAGARDVYGQTMAQATSWSFTSGDERSFVDGPAGTRFYLASQPSKVPLRYRNFSEVRHATRALDLTEWMTARSKGWEAERDWLLTQPWSTRTLQGTGVDNRTHAEWFDFGAMLRGGHGVVQSSLAGVTPGEEESDVSPAEGTLVVTDLAATVKLGASGALVWVTSLSGGSPVKAAEVCAYHAGTERACVKTDRDGAAAISPEQLGDRSVDGRLVVIARKGADATYTDVDRDELSRWSLPVDAWGPETSFPREAHAFADRGVYRPGDTAHVRVMLRDLLPEGLRAPAPMTLPWTLRTPEGDEAGTGEVRTNEHGNATLDVTLPANAAPGEWYLRMGDVAGVDLPVRAYRAPVFRVDVKTPESVRAGGTLRADVGARYLHGAVMRGAPVMWSSFRMPYVLAPKGWDAWSFDEPWDPARQDDGYGESGDGYGQVGTGEGTVVDGTLAIAQPLPVAEWTRPTELWVEATVDDVDGQSVAGRAKTVVHVADAYPAVRADTVGEAGKPVEVALAVVRPDGTGVGGTVHVEVTRTTWDNVREKAMDGTWRWVSAPRTETVVQADVTTAAGGTPWRFTPTAAGTFRVLATPRDGAGKATAPAAGAIVWVGGSDAAWARSDDNLLDLVPDRTVYAPGATAKVLVRAPRPGMRALVTVERDGVLWREVRTLRTTSETLRIPLRREWQPNVFVSVVAVDGAGKIEGPDAGRPGAWFGAARLAIESADQRLAVTVTPGRTDLGPRETVDVALQVAREGRPVKDAELQVWAVDEGVLSLTGYRVPDPFDTFYALRPLKVSTSDNRGDLYDRARALAKGAAPGGSGGVGDARRRFVTTPFWSGTVHTDGAGRAKVAFTLPDNLTTFRIMAVADDGGAAFGGGQSEVRVRRPLMVRPALPRFLRPGDTLRAGVVVHNDTPASMAVRVEGTLTGATLSGLPTTVEVPANTSVEVPFGVSGPQGDRVAYRFSVSAADPSLRDSIEASLPVRDARFEERSGSAGNTTSSATETIALPRGAVAGRGGLDVRVGSTALVGLESGVEDLLAYPWGCLEQTGSRVRARIAALAAGDRLRGSLDEATLKRGVEEELARLARFRAWNGYAYWPGQDTDGASSAYALEVLREARDAGFAIDEAAWSAALEGSRRWLVGETWDPASQERASTELPARLRGALALHRARKSDPSVVNRLWERRKELTRSQRAMLLELLGPDPRGKALLQELEGAVALTTTTARLQADGGWERWFGAETPTTALTRALLAARPDHPLLPRLAAGIVGARRGGRWSNTWTTAESLRALVDYAARFDKDPVKAEVRLGATTLLSSSLGRSGVATASVPLANLAAGPLRFESIGGGRLYYEATMRWTPENPAPREEGFTVARTVEVLEGSVLRAGGVREVPVGAVVRVSVTVVTPQERRDVALVDQLPAGLEPLDGGFETEPYVRGPVDYEASWVFDRREVYDDRVAWFADIVPAGVHTLSYRARATRPGTYTLPPGAVEAMYDPTEYARGAFGTFTVREATAR